MKEAQEPISTVAMASDVACFNMPCADQRLMCFVGAANKALLFKMKMVAHSPKTRMISTDEAGNELAPTLSATFWLTCCQGATNDGSRRLDQNDTEPEMDKERSHCLSNSSTCVTWEMPFEEFNLLIRETRWHGKKR